MRKIKFIPTASVVNEGKKLREGKKREAEGINPLNKSKKKSKSINSLIPGYDYPLLLDLEEVKIDDTRKIVFSVRRAGDAGLICLDIRQYSTTEAYTGFTKKGIYFPVDIMNDLIGVLCKIERECYEKGFDNN